MSVPSLRTVAMPALRRRRLLEIKHGARITHSATGRIGLALGVVVLIVLCAGLLTPAEPNAVAIQDEYLSPSLTHPLGTDAYGRDQLARLAAGGMASLAAAALVLMISLTVALVVGVASGLAGGFVDAVVMRINDVLLSIPSIVLAMAVIGALGPGFVQLVSALSVAYVATFTRLARAFTVTCRQREDILAARLAGVPWWTTVRGHVIPGVAAQLGVVSTLTIGDIVISIAGLSFLGLGIQPPTAEWGSMLAESQSAFYVAPWLLLAPAAAILGTAAAVNLIADSLREGDHR
ncbi:ABC transporter permease (plasmid) [Nocardioides sp. R1-1]|uniref:ABC transporter permease n=1 Tax=Nocardioides sp. R1-1 TaxID=3383502 RepID=UPI0038CFB646